MAGLGPQHRGDPGEQQQMGVDRCILAPLAAAPPQQRQRQQQDREEAQRVDRIAEQAMTRYRQRAECGGQLAQRAVESRTGMPGDPFDAAAEEPVALPGLVAAVLRQLGNFRDR